MAIYYEEEKKYYRARWFGIFKKAVACLAVIIAISAITIVSVEAMRFKFINTVTELKEEYLKIGVHEISSSNDNRVAYILEDMPDVYIPDYLPDSFVLKDVSNTHGNYTLTYAGNNDNKVIIRQLLLIKNPSIGIDTENTQIDKVIINNLEVNVIEKINEITSIRQFSIYWQSDEFLFVVHASDIDRNSLLYIIGSMKKHS
jgi:hypothetical protein